LAAGNVVAARPSTTLPYVAYGETDDNLFCTSKGLDTSKLKKT
jgi:urea transport system substrate-binding protein